MSDTSPDIMPSSDARLELSMAALRSERRNRPRLLLVVSSLVFAISVVYLIVTFTMRTTTYAALGRANSSLANITGVVSQLRALEQTQNAPKYDPDPDMVPKLQRFATQIGLPRVEIASKDPTTSAGVKGFLRRVYTTTINEADPELLLRWVAESTDGRNFPGLEVEQIKLIPGRTMESGKVGWTLDVSFRRWERQP